jgi:hypothetical protein
MRWMILTLSLSLLICSTSSQVTIQGTVTPSADQTAAISGASVQFIRLDINGRDTTRVALGKVQTDQSGRFSYLLVTDVQQSQQNLPQKFALTSSYPNPFQTTTQVGLSVPKSDNFTIAVYNILGQEVARLERVLSVGLYSIQWDGSSIPGVYFVVAKSGGEMRFIKLIQLQKNSGPSALRITGASSSFQTKVAGTQSIAVASSVQVTVSKQLYQTYVSPVLNYSNQSLTIPLLYIGTGPISAVKRDSAFKGISTQFKALMGSLSKAEAAKAMAAWLNKQPQFEAAGVADDGSVWCRFTDGTMAIFANNLEPGATSTSHSMAMSQRPQLKLNDTPPTELPSKGTAIASGSLGEIFGHPEIYVADMVTRVGYTLAYAQEVDELKSKVNNIGVFFINGHGGYGTVPWGGSEYAVWTETTQSLQKDSIYYDDLREHRLVWMYGNYNIDTRDPNAPDTVMKWNYAFTGQFVRKYMSFAEKSLAYVAGCSTATNNAFVNAFLAKGASAYAGYSNTAWSDFLCTSTKVFFDRTLGTNYPYVDQKETPPQRAFDWPAVLTWMQSKKLDYGAADGSTKLVLVPKSGSTLGPLAPSIATMSVHPYEQKLYIYGIFGENPGSDGVVTVNNTPSQVLEWAYDGQTQMNRIVCKIPDDGAGSYGDVQVKVHQIKSNTTQLSRYKGNFTLVHETMDGRKYEVKLTLQFRVHLLGFRMQPGEKPMFNQPNYCVYADMGSKGEYTASGSTGGQVFWTGHATDLHNNIDGAAAVRSYEAGAWFDPEQKKMQLYMSGGIKDGIIQTMGSTITPMLMIYGVDEFDGKHGYLPSYVEIPLQPNFSITKDKRSAKKVTTYYSMLGPMMDTVRIEWDDITCEAPPKAETAR